MSVVLKEIILAEAASANATEEPRRRRWTVDEYYRMAEVGLLGPDERTELIDGEVLRMSPQNSRHATVIGRVERALRGVLPEGLHLRTQMPLRLSQETEPEPDLAVVTGDLDDYADAHPTTAALVVEISDSTLRFDRRAKAAVYAQAGIPEYWVVNVRRREVEVHTQPVDDPAAGWNYASIVPYREGDEIQPLAVAEASLPVREFFPR